MSKVKGMTIVGYVRVSRVGDREGDNFLSPALQREAVEGLAEREGLEVAEWIEELDAVNRNTSTDCSRRRCGRCAGRPVRNMHERARARWKRDRRGREALIARN